jgi:hypothetical protein
VKTRKTLLRIGTRGRPMVDNPAMRRVLLDQVISTDFGQLDLGWADSFGFDGHFDRFYGGQVNGLVGASDPRGVHVNLARRSGGSKVRIELCDHVPDLPEPAWEDVVEVSVAIPAGAQPRWATWAGEHGGPLPVPTGSYRLRVCANGRDAGRDSEFAERVVDFYLLQLWPGLFEQDAVIRVGSQDAAYWHREVGSRR